MRELELIRIESTFSLRGFLHRGLDRDCLLHYLIRHSDAKMKQSWRSAKFDTWPGARLLWERRIFYVSHTVGPFEIVNAR